MKTGARDIGAVLRANLAERIGNERYELWFGSSTQLQLRDGLLRVMAPNDFFVDWLRANFRRDLERCCQDVIGEALAIEFCLDDEAPPQDASPQDAAPQPRRRPPRQDPAPAGDSTTSPPVRHGGRRFASLKEFVTGPCNSLAYTSARMAADRPGGSNPLLLYGPTAVGKTHLLEGLYCRVRANRRAQAVFLSAEQFTSSFLEALHGGGLPNFRRKYRGLDLLIIDDLQFFRGKKATIIELLHTIDTSLRLGRQIAFSADRSPAELTDLGPELLTRMQGGLMCPMEPPDRNVRLGILDRLARQAELELPADVRDFIVNNLTSHAREMAGAVNRLAAKSLAQQSPVTLPMAEAELQEMVRHSGRVIRLKDIEQAVCDVFGLEPKTLQSARKARAVSRARMLAMWLARKHTSAALTEIGHYFGRRSHSTVVSAQKKINAWMVDGLAVELSEQDWTAEEAIRRVETKLRVG